jgi:hypothetical protein
MGLAMDLAIESDASALCPDALVDLEYEGVEA